MAEQTIPNWLAKRTFLTPERIAVESSGHVWTYRELDERARTTAAKFACFGVREGDRVALLVKNGMHTVEIIHALHYIGAVLVPLNVRLSADELAWQVTDADPRLFVYDCSQEEKAKAVAEKVPGCEAVSWGTLASTDPGSGTPPLKRVMALDALHSIMYTSGTTGRPKGVMLTYGNHWWSAVSSALNLGLHTGDRWLACVPMFHMSGLSILIRSVIYGITLVVHESFQPDVVNRALMKEKVTIVSVVSAMLDRMVEQLGSSAYPETFRCMLLGGGPVPLPLLDKCLRKRIPVFQTYGLTETASQIATLPPEYMADKSGSAGKPLFPSELRIVADGKEQLPGQEGEIVVKGPTVTPGYWKRERATANTLRDGWLHTGDIGYVDEDGFLYVLDRRSDLIISGGENVYPAEVESHLTSHPAVREAGVTGVPHPRWGQVPVAFVSLKDDHAVSEEALRQYCREKLAKYKVPVRIHFVDKLPRNASNKLLRRELLKLL